MHAAPCGIFHVDLHEDYMYLHCSNSNFSLDTAAFTKPVDFKVELYFWLREIAKFSSTS